MNIEYIIKDDEAIIIDDKDRDKEPIKYYDNLDEVLVKENVIEKIEKEIKDYKKQIKLCSNYILFNKIFMLILTGVILGIILTFKELMTPLFIQFGMTAYITFSIKVFEKLKKGIEVQVKFLKQEQNNQKEKIEELKKDLTITKYSKDLKAVKVDDEYALEVLKKRKQNFFDIGYNLNKFKKYNQNNELKEIVDKEDIEIVKEILEEKGPVLAKKKR